MDYHSNSIYVMKSPKELKSLVAVASESNMGQGLLQNGHSSN